MSRIIITHLTFIGENVEPARVEFGRNLTLVHGPSDTGKSFIVDALDFMMGAKDLKDIPERKGYSTVLLGLESPEGYCITLSRSTYGGDFNVYYKDIRQGPLPIPNYSLKPQHALKDTSNISYFFLHKINLVNKKVRKNKYGATNALSFRDIVRFCVIDETSMQSEKSPVLTGQRAVKTKEISVFKLLLQGEDDSDITETVPPKERSIVKHAKLELIDALSESIKGKISTDINDKNLEKELKKINILIEEKSHLISNILTNRNEIIDLILQKQESIISAKSELNDIGVLKCRFSLLKEQYTSDLYRLETIKETGTLLGYFKVDVCPFCGAEPKHQNHGFECDNGATALAEATDVEMQKTEKLLKDLLTTITELERREQVILRNKEDLEAHIGDLEGQAKVLEDDLKPVNNSLQRLLETRSDIENTIALYNQVKELNLIRNDIESSHKREEIYTFEEINHKNIREFSERLSRRLQNWGYPEGKNTRYDRSKQDIYAGDQFRAEHGKGVRAILHAAFTVSLAQYCFEKKLPHPGFVILDSPIVTYRPPGNPDITQVDSDLPSNIVAKFYEDLQSNFDGQIIIMENLDPDQPLHEGSKDLTFTKGAHGRYGFFPHPADESEGLLD